MNWRPPERESLLEALKRVVDAGAPVDLAKGRICTDIAQDQIRICPYVASEFTGKPDVQLRSKRQYRVPPRLAPGDFDWDNSRPLRPWPVDRTARDGWEDTPITFLELRTEDVIDRLCSHPNLLTGEKVEATDQQRAQGNTSTEASSVNSNICDRGKSRGPRPNKREAVEAAMQRDIENKKISRQQLHEMPDKIAEKKYGSPHDAKRTTVRQARQNVLSEFQPNNTDIHREKTNSDT